MLYIFWILHQTTTCGLRVSECRKLYIFWILHQTTTPTRPGVRDTRCISFESYIKPQLLDVHDSFTDVVYLLNPTSNHNLISWVCSSSRLYIFWILHQTTTSCRSKSLLSGCISFESYIKPQLYWYAITFAKVVYLLNPTSNHNKVSLVCSKTLLYIFWILHQTTTTYVQKRFGRCCISFESYIKPQPLGLRWLNYCVVYLLNPTSNHNQLTNFIVKYGVVYLLNPTSNHNL